MRAICVASAALLGMSALSSCAPAALASGDDGHYGVSGCRGSVTVSSEVFATVTIPRGSSSAVALVDRDARPGATYRVTFTCGGVSAVKELTVISAGPQPLPLHPVPHGVHAGEGGSAGGFDLREIGLGAALIAGSIGAAYRLTRRGGGEEDAAA